MRRMGGVAVLWSLGLTMPGCHGDETGCDGDSYCFGAPEPLLAGLDRSVVRTLAYPNRDSWVIAHVEGRPAPDFVHLFAMDLDSPRIELESPVQTVDITSLARADGSTDLVTAHADGSVWTVRPASAGATEESVEWTWTPLWHSPKPIASLAAADVDGDGHDELLVSSPGELTMLAVDGTVVQLRQSLVADDRRPWLGDLTGDGRDDLLVAHGSQLRMHAALPAGSSVPFAPEPTPLSEIPARSVFTIADMDQDFAPDIVAGVGRRLELTLALALGTQGGPSGPRVSIDLPGELAAIQVHRDAWRQARVFVGLSSTDPGYAPTTGPHVFALTREAGTWRLDPASAEGMLIPEHRADGDVERPLWLRSRDSNGRLAARHATAWPGMVVHDGPLVPIERVLDIEARTALERGRSLYDLGVDAEGRRAILRATISRLDVALASDLDSISRWRSHPLAPAIEDVLVRPATGLEPARVFVSRRSALADAGEPTRELQVFGLEHGALHPLAPPREFVFSQGLTGPVRLGMADFDADGLDDLVFGPFGRRRREFDLADPPLYVAFATGPLTFAPPQYVGLGLGFMTFAGTPGGSPQLMVATGPDDVAMYASTSPGALVHVGNIEGQLPGMATEMGIQSRAGTVGCVTGEFESSFVAWLTRRDLPHRPESVELVREGSFTPCDPLAMLMQAPGPEVDARQFIAHGPRVSSRVILRPSSTHTTGVEWLDAGQTVGFGGDDNLLIDLDGDGVEDLVSANTVGYQPSEAATPTSNPFALAVVRGRRGVHWQFGDSWPLQSVHSSDSPPPGDFDGDGRLELLHPTHGVIGLDDRKRRAELPAKLGHARRGSPRVLDCDGDGRDEILTLSPALRGIGIAGVDEAPDRVLLHAVHLDPDFALESFVAETTLSVDFAQTGHFVAEHDGVLVFDETRGTLHLFACDLDLGPREISRFAWPLRSRFRSDTSRLRVSKLDTDADGLDGLVVVELDPHGNPTTAWHLPRPLQPEGPIHELSFGALMGGAVRSFDFGGDGRESLLFTRLRTIEHESGWQWSDALPAFAFPDRAGRLSLVSLDDERPQPHAPRRWSVVADLDGDGAEELLVRLSGGLTVLAHDDDARHLGTRTFPDAFPSWVLDDRTEITAHDFDGDGDDDFLLRHPTHGYWSVENLR